MVLSPKQTKTIYQQNNTTEWALQEMDQLENIKQAISWRCSNKKELKIDPVYDCES